MNIFVEVKTDTGQVLALMALPPKVFKSKSRGYWANGKIEIEGKRYQAQFQLVEIGSKPTEEESPNL